MNNNQFSAVIVIILSTVCFQATAGNQGDNGHFNKHKYPSPVPKTGMTTCYDPLGIVISCQGTGQDGELQKGVSVKESIPRFQDMQDGSVRDNLTGLIWLKNADCFGGSEWIDALVASNKLSAPSCGLRDNSVAGDWRLPNVKELLSLIDYGHKSPSLSNAQGKGHWREGDPFSNVQLNGYWSSTWNSTSPFVEEGGFFWGLSFIDGQMSGHSSNSPLYVWPVRDESISHRNRKKDGFKR